MMFSDVDLLFANSLSDDLNQNSVTSVIFIANVPEFNASDRFEQTRSVFKFYCVFPRTQKPERFLLLIANVLFISIKFFVEKLFVDFCVFVNSNICLRSDRCVIKDIFA